MLNSTAVQLPFAEFDASLQLGGFPLAHALFSPDPAGDLIPLALIEPVNAHRELRRFVCDDPTFAVAQGRLVTEGLCGTARSALAFGSVVMHDGERRDGVVVEVRPLPGGRLVLGHQYEFDGDVLVKLAGPLLQENDGTWLRATGPLLERLTVGFNSHRHAVAAIGEMTAL